MKNWNKLDKFIYGFMYHVSQDNYVKHIKQLKQFYEKIISNTLAIKLWAQLCN